jgi:hypothetical protein
VGVLILLILIFLLTLLVLAGVLWGGSLFAQGYLYSEPAGDLIWRAPAAAAALTLFLVAWTVADCASGGHVRPVHQMSVYDTKTFDELKVAVKESGQQKEEVYKREARTARDYHLAGNPERKLPSRPEKVTVTENGADVTFEPDRDAKGHFKTEQGQNLLYRDARGRVMDEGHLGEVSVFRWDWLFWNLLFNAGFLAAWFLCLWLLLRFQWGHALLGAFALWLVMLFVVQMLLGYAEQVAGLR